MTSLAALFSGPLVFCLGENVWLTCAEETVRIEWAVPIEYWN